MAYAHKINKKPSPFLKRVELVFQTAPKSPKGDLPSHNPNNSMRTNVASVSKFQLRKENIQSKFPFRGQGLTKNPLHF